MHGLEPWHAAGEHAVNRASASWWAPAENKSQSGEMPPPWLGWPTSGPSQDKLSLKMRAARSHGHVDWQRWSAQTDVAAKRPRSFSPKPRKPRPIGPWCPNYGAAVPAIGRRGRHIQWPPADTVRPPARQPVPEPQLDDASSGFLDQMHHAFVELSGGGSSPSLAAPRVAVVDLMDRRWWDLPSSMRPAWWELRARIEKDSLSDPYILWGDFAAMLKVLVPSVASSLRPGWFTEDEYVRPPPVAAEPPQTWCEPPDAELSRGVDAVVAEAGARIRAEWEARLEALLSSVELPHVVRPPQPRPVIPARSFPAMPPEVPVVLEVPAAQVPAAQPVSAAPAAAAAPVAAEGVLDREELVEPDDSSAGLQEVHSDDYEGYARLLAKSFSRGHDVVANDILKFMEEAWRASPVQEISTSNFEPFQFRTGGFDDEMETIRLQLVVQGKDDWFGIAHSFSQRVTRQREIPVIANLPVAAPPYVPAVPMFPDSDLRSARDLVRQKLSALKSHTRDAVQALDRQCAVSPMSSPRQPVR